MTNEERQVLKKFNAGNISNDEFLEQYPSDFKNSKNYIYLLVKEAFDKQDEIDFDLALNLIVFSPDVAYTYQFVDLLCMQALELVATRLCNRLVAGIKMIR